MRAGVIILLKTLVYPALNSTIQLHSPLVMVSADEEQKHQTAEELRVNLKAIQGENNFSFPGGVSVQVTNHAGNRM